MIYGAFCLYVDFANKKKTTNKQKKTPDRLVATLLVFPVQMQSKKSSEQGGNEPHVTFFFTSMNHVVTFSMSSPYSDFTRSII